MLSDLFYVIIGFATMIIIMIIIEEIFKTALGICIALIMLPIELIAYIIDKIKGVK